jgi:hypothetical protein
MSNRADIESRMTPLIERPWSNRGTMMERARDGNSDGDMAR